MTESTVVTDDQQFIDQLQDGDILLFDKLGAIHRLVQWADNRPVGHCGIWCAGHLYEATILEKDGVKSSGVFRTDLSELLGKKVHEDRGPDVSLVRSVTAMRHRDITTGTRQEIARIAARSTDSGHFAERDMVLLAPYALRRSYALEANQLQDLLNNVIRVCKLLMPKTDREPGEPQRVFCSQFVYRTFRDAGLPITIANSLHDAYQATKRARQSADRLGDQGRYGSRDNGTDVPFTAESDPWLLAAYDDWFEEEVLGTPDDDGSSSRGPYQWVFKRRSPDLEEMVTPGDYWTSASLEPIVSLYRPPGR